MRWIGIVRSHLYSELNAAMSAMPFWVNMEECKITAEMIDGLSTITHLKLPCEMV